MHDGSTEHLFELLSAFKPDIVIHAATLFIAAHRPEDITSLVASNITFGAQLLDAMARAGVRRMINFGTSWQHGGATNEYIPVSLYASTKQAFEDLAAYYTSACGLSVLTLKLSDTYGPNDRRQKLIALLLRIAHTGEPLALSPGGQIINFVHSADVVEAVRLAIARVIASPAGLESFAVRGAELLSLRQFVDLFQETLGVKVNAQWGARPYRDREVMRPWIGPLLPGWTPQIDLRAGLLGLAPTLG